MALAQTPGLRLETALQALPQSPGWRLADLEYQNSQRALQSAQAASGFKINLETSYNLTNPIEPPTAAQNTARVGATASVGVLPWSSNGDAARAAGRVLEQAELSRQEARNALVINAYSLYFALRQATQELELAQATLRLRENQLRAVTVQNQNGQASREAVLQAQQSLEAAQLEQVSAIGKLQLARLELATTLGLSSAGLSATSAPGPAPLPTTSLENLIAEALTRRPDLRRAQIALQSAQERLGNRQLNRWLPDTNLSLGYGERSSENQQGRQASAGLNLKSGELSLRGSLPLANPPLPANGFYNRSWSVGVSLNLPLFDPLADAETARNQAEVELAQANLETLRSKAELEIRQRYLEAQTAQARIELAQAGLNLARQTLETSQARLSAGLVTALEVQTRQIAQSQAERDLEAAQAGAVLALLKLQNALGINLTGGVR